MKTFLLVDRNKNQYGDKDTGESLMNDELEPESPSLSLVDGDDAVSSGEDKSLSASKDRSIDAMAKNIFVISVFWCLFATTASSIVYSLTTEPVDPEQLRRNRERQLIERYEVEFEAADSEPEDEPPGQSSSLSDSMLFGKLAKELEGVTKGLHKKATPPKKEQKSVAKAFVDGEIIGDSSTAKPKTPPSYINNTSGHLTVGKKKVAFQSSIALLLQSGRVLEVALYDHTLSEEVARDLAWEEELLQDSTHRPVMLFRFTFNPFKDDCSSYSLQKYSVFIALGGKFQELERNMAYNQGEELTTLECTRAAGEKMVFESSAKPDDWPKTQYGTLQWSVSVTSTFLGLEE